MTDLQFWGVILFLAFAGGFGLGYILAAMRGAGDGYCPECEDRYRQDLERARDDARGMA